MMLKSAKVAFLPGERPCFLLTLQIKAEVLLTLTRWPLVCKKRKIHDRRIKTINPGQ